MPLSKIFEKCKANRYLWPLTTRPFSNPLPTNHNPNKHYDYHQNSGHTTDYCLALRSTIQDLIEEKLLIPPKSCPNTATNPLPKNNTISNTNTSALLDFVKRDVNHTNFITLILWWPLDSHDGYSVFVLDLNSFMDEDDEINAITRKGHYAQYKDLLVE